MNPAVNNEALSLLQLRKDVLLIAKTLLASFDQEGISIEFSFSNALRSELIPSAFAMCIMRRGLSLQPIQFTVFKCSNNSQ